MATEKGLPSSMQDQLFALVVGELLLNMVKDQGWLEQVETRAIRLLGQLQLILDDSGLDDAARLQRIKKAMADTGLYTGGHGPEQTFGVSILT